MERKSISLLPLKRTGGVLWHDSLIKNEMYIDVDYRGYYSIMELRVEELALLRQALAAYVQSHLGRIPHQDAARIQNFDRHFKLIQDERKEQAVDQR